ncbi:MAG: hypothetical protein ACRD2X_21975 [Vicinamibacteraceae bacterium]
MELRDEQVGIVAGVGHDRQALDVPGQIVGLTPVIATEQELVAIGALVEVRLAYRAGAVDGFQVEARAAEVAQAAHLLTLPERRAVVSQIVCQDLTEEGPARGNARVIGRAIR